MSVKHSRSEIDALFLATEQVPDGFQEIIVTCEAKGLGENIIEEQVVSQLKTVFHLQGVHQDTAIAIGVEVVGVSEVLVTEYNAVSRDEVDELETLTVAGQAVYELVPPVPGIGGHRAQRGRSQRTSQ